MPVAKDILLRQSLGLARCIFATVISAEAAAREPMLACSRAAVMLEEKLCKCDFEYKLLQADDSSQVEMIAAWLNGGHELALHNLSPWIGKGGLLA
ncbi:hypothetical protein ABBQ38_000747 [Trebouxia sp. C0009 RCD-2024]